MKLPFVLLSPGNLDHANGKNLSAGGRVAIQALPINLAQAIAALISLLYVLHR